MKVSELLKQFESQQKSVAEQKIETIQENVAPIVSAQKPVKIVAKNSTLKNLKS